jgi:hypothetical protein
LPRLRAEQASQGLIGLVINTKLVAMGEYDPVRSNRGIVYQLDTGFRRQTTPEEKITITRHQ